MLTGCSGDSPAVPQTAEEIDTFADVLAFVSGQTDVDVTEVQVQAESSVMPTETVPLSDEDAADLLAWMDAAPVTAELYDSLAVYGGVSYSVICTLENGETVTLYPKEDALTFTRAELNGEEKWHYPPYRLLYEDSGAAERICTAVRQFWNDAYSIPAGETRTAAQILGDDILDARQLILRLSLDGKSGTEIRLYVDTAAHPDLFDAVTGLTLEQAEVEKGEPYIEIFPHTGDEDYRFGKHLLKHCLTIRGERLKIDVGTDISYRMVTSDGSSFTDWLVDWVHAHRDDDGVKIARWDVE